MSDNQNASNETFAVTKAIAESYELCLSSKSFGNLWICLHVIMFI